MKDFAKLFTTVDGGQVLVYMDSNDDGKPTLYQMTDVDGITAKIGKSYRDTEDGEEQLDEAFCWFGVLDAEAFRDGIKAMLIENS